MVTIRNIKKFHCPACDYITEDPATIERIEQNGGRCPACGGERSTKWEAKHKPKYGASNG